jgi:hypothetical protein
MSLFISIRRLETVQRNSLNIKFRNEETRGEQFIKSVNNWGFHSDKREYCTNYMELLFLFVFLALQPIVVVFSTAR